MRERERGRVRYGERDSTARKREREREKKEDTEGENIKNECIFSNCYSPSMHRSWMKKTAPFS